MRVEGPQTFMTAYQQGRQNRRQDEQDNQKLAFSIFGEKRARDKHDAFIDRAEEGTRHAKTMNPLMESLRLYENQLKFNTLDSEISRHKEKTRADEQSHILSEAKKRSDLDYSTYSRGQDSSQYNYGTATTKEQQDNIDVRRKSMDNLVQGGLDESLLIQDTDKQLNQIDNSLAKWTGNEFDKQIGNNEEEKRKIASNILNNSYVSPGEALSEDYEKLFRRFELDKRSEGYESSILDLGDDRIKLQAENQKEIERLSEEERELFKKPDRYSKARARDIKARIKYLNAIVNGGLLQGNGINNLMQRTK